MIQQYSHIWATLFDALFNNLLLFVLRKNASQLQHYIFEFLSSKNAQDTLQGWEAVRDRATLEEADDNIAEALANQLRLMKPSLPEQRSTNMQLFLEVIHQDQLVKRENTNPSKVRTFEC